MTGHLIMSHWYDWHDWYWNVHVPQREKERQDGV